MDNIRNTCLRFNLRKPVHNKAWEYLQQLDKSEFKSYSNAIAISVADYFERHYRNQADPYFENREREEEFVNQIIREVEKALSNSVPNFLTACLAGIKTANRVSVTEATPDTTNADIDYDFVGG